MQNLFSFLVVVVTAPLFACAVDTRPVDIEAGDMCSFCRMAISQKQYAAEIIDPEGNVVKFDDVGCMLRYQHTGSTKFAPAAIFVADSDSKKWINAEQAYFVRSDVKTPMGSGIIAFASREKAGEGGVSYSRLLKE